jgi:nitrate/nitrite transporter NarK
MGYAAAVGATVITMRGVISLASTPLWGALCDRVDPRWLLMAKFGCYALGILMLMQAKSISSIILAVGIYSVAFAGTNVVAEVAWANYYGRQSLGVIRGFSMPIAVLFSAAGPIVAGTLYTMTGSYNSSFWGIIGTASLSAILMMFCSRPRRAA